MGLTATPSATVGPYLHLGLNWLATTDLAKGASAGERITISGALFDADGQPISDALLEIWQANAQGKYAHPEDVQEKPVDPGFSGFGRIPTGRDGRFSFVTVRPGRVPGPGNTLQAPHILVAIFMRGLLRHLYTRIYFSDQASANAEDPILGLIDDPARRATLIAQRAADSAQYRWDVFMQGATETVFLDC